MCTARLCIVPGRGVVTFDPGQGVGGIMTFKPGQGVGEKEVLWLLTLAGGGGGVVTFDPGREEVLWPLSLASGRCYDLWAWPGGVLWPLTLAEGGGVMTFDPGQGGGGWPLVLSTSPSLVGQTDACENITFGRFDTRAVKSILVLNKTRLIFYKAGTMPNGLETTFIECDNATDWTAETTARNLGTCGKRYFLNYKWIYNWWEVFEIFQDVLFFSVKTESNNIFSIFLHVKHLKVET